MAAILVADDEPEILDVMVEALENAGHDVVGVVDGLAALQAVEKKSFDVVLLDVMMPKVDGYHVASRIRSLANPPKIIIVTSRDFLEDRNVVQASGADAFLSKPFSNKDLLDVVSALIPRKKSKE